MYLTYTFDAMGRVATMKNGYNASDGSVTNWVQGITYDPADHLVLQGKGGVGKSLVASWLAEFLMSRGQPVRCIDGDPVNRSLGQYKLSGARSSICSIGAASSSGAATTPSSTGF